jgi:hypothetical protein
LRQAGGYPIAPRNRQIGSAQIPLDGDRSRTLPRRKRLRLLSG